MRGFSVVLAASIAILATAVDAGQAGRAQDPRPALAPAVSEHSQRALLDRYCVTCHNERLQRGDLSFDAVDLTDVSRDAGIWEKVVRKLHAGMMPPPGRPRPDPPTYVGFASWLEAELDRAAAAHPNPGRTVALHRLNRTEYQNAIRDLLALDVSAETLLPADDQSYGFDNIGGVLSVSPTLLERYMSAAWKLSRLAVGATAQTTAETFRLRGDLGQDDHLEGLPFGTRGGTIIHYNFPQDADYAIDVELQGPRSETHHLEVMLDGEQTGSFTLESAPIVPNVDGELMSTVPSLRLPVKAGPHEVAVTFVKTSSIVPDGVREPFLRPYNRQLQLPRVHGVTITGPLISNDGRGSESVGDSPSRRAIFTCTPDVMAQEEPCARSILAKLARRAYRRPVRDADVDVLLGFYREGAGEGGFEAGIESALRRLLVSPEFLFRVERDPEGVAPNTAYRISDLELASRLSFFLWSSIPDEALLVAASQGALATPAVLEEQVRRMLADPRTGALVDSFGVQ